MILSLLLELTIPMVCPCFFSSSSKLRMPLMGFRHDISLFNSRLAFLAMNGNLIIDMSNSLKISGIDLSRSFLTSFSSIVLS